MFLANTNRQKQTYGDVQHDFTACVAGTAYPSEALWYTAGFLWSPCCSYIYLVFSAVCVVLLVVLFPVWPMSPMSLDRPFLIILSVFSNIYQHLSHKRKIRK